jgi:hypothetical protein
MRNCPESSASGPFARASRLPGPESARRRNSGLSGEIGRGQLAEDPPAPQRPINVRHDPHDVGRVQMPETTQIGTLRRSLRSRLMIARTQDERIGTVIPVLGPKLQVGQ